MWSPEVDYTFFATDRVAVAGGEDADMRDVFQTDAIVCGIRNDIVEFARKVDCGKNNLGWGIDYLCVARALVTGKKVVRDKAVQVGHPRGRGYEHGTAMRQMDEFIARLPPEENGVVAILRALNDATLELRQCKEAALNGARVPTPRLVKQLLDRALGRRGGRGIAG